MEHGNCTQALMSRQTRSDVVVGAAVSLAPAWQGGLQLAHLPEPDLLENVPIGQIAHEVGVSAKVPAEQGWHARSELRVGGDVSIVPAAHVVTVSHVPWA